LVLVLAIWGILGFKILKTVNPSPQITTQITSKEKFVPITMEKRDTFSISANYRDPFLGTMPKVDRPKKTKIIVSQKKELPEKIIVYTGFVTESSSKKKIFFLTIDGEQQMMSKNGSFKEVKLLSGNSEKIKVRYNGKTENIPLIQ